MVTHGSEEVDSGAFTSCSNEGEPGVLTLGSEGVESGVLAYVSEES